MKAKKTILVIEDNELNREILASILDEDYNVIEVENGAVGFDMLKSKGRDISIVLLDLRMPVMDGFEFLECVRQDGRFVDIPIIVTTASEQLEDEIRSLEMGASDFVTKPYNPDVVLKRIGSLVRLRETSSMLNRIERDPITGLYTKNSFMVHAREILDLHPNEEFDLAFICLIGYRTLEDRYGKQRCEELQKEFAEKILKVLPERSVTGILSDSSIALVCPNTVFKNNTREIEEYFAGYAEMADVPFSIKIGLYPLVDRSLTIETMCNNALLAMYTIRDTYHKTIAEYNNAIREKQEREQRILESMAEGLRERQFKAYYQPKHSLLRDVTAGAEALVRWIHPKYGFMSPGDFIPLFEHNGFIRDLDLYMLDAVCRDQRRWLDSGLKPVPVSLNISQSDFDMDDLADELEAIVDKHGIPHELIHFEVTESVNAVNSAKKAEEIRKFREKKFKVELDDFGSGFSSLSALAEMPFDVLKLDMSLVRNMFGDRYQAVLDGALYIARKLNAAIVAEGVETKEQVNGLLELCNDCSEIYAQGYYYSKPVPAEQFEQMLDVAK